MATLASQLTVVRETLEDIESGAYRVSDSIMIGYANDFVRETCLLRPDLFSTIGDITCSSGTCLQSAPTGSVVLMDVFQVKSGRVVTEVDRELIDRFNTGWWSDTAAAAENWIRHEKDPAKFFIYPKAPANQILVGQWAVLPSAMAATSDSIPAQILDAYLPGVHHYIVFRCLARPNDPAKMAAATPFYEAYLRLFSLGKATKAEAEQEDVD